MKRFLIATGCLVSLSACSNNPPHEELNQSESVQATETLSLAGKSAPESAEELPDKMKIKEDLIGKEVTGEWIMGSTIRFKFTSLSEIENLEVVNTFSEGNISEFYIEVNFKNSIDDDISQKRYDGIWGANLHIVYKKNSDGKWEFITLDDQKSVHFIG